MEQAEKLIRAVVTWYNDVPSAQRGIVMFIAGLIVGGILF